MEQEKRYRHEMKYSIPYTDYLAVRARLRSVMEPDRHTMDDGTYRIRSIYFDNTDDKALREKIDGIGKREKFKIRYYNDDLSFISLEKKMKIDSLCLKYDAVITVDECRKILDGDLDFMKEHPEALVRELYAKMKYQLLRPRVLVSYLREPYIYKPGKAAEESTSEKAEESTTAAEKPANENPDESGDGTKSTESSDKSSSKFSGRGGFGGKGGANLNYIDDELDSYSTIWEGEITGTSKGDHRRVVTALKNISEGTDLETYLDVDNVLKYMAVHVFAVNMDSLSGSMAHNYYLYEYNGQLNLFPWDYNLSFGGMSAGRSGGATEMVNDAIDTPFAGTQFFDALLENEEYLEKYHSYLKQLVDEYVNGSKLDEFYERVRSQIDSLVETDPTAFYTYEEYQTAADMLCKTVQLRAESIDGQLNGTIPSTDDGQRADSSAFVDASDIDIKAMGEFNMGFGGSSGDKNSDESSGTDNSEDSKSKSDEKPAENKSADENSSENEGNSRPSFSGMPSGSSNQTMIKI